MHRTLSRDIPQEVLNYRLDLGTVSYVPQDPKLAAVEILRDELTFVVPPKHRLARRPSVDIKELGRGNLHRAQRRFALPLARHPAL